MPVYKDKKPTSDGRQYYFMVSISENGKYKKYKSKKYMTKKECAQAEAVYLTSNERLTDRHMTIGDLCKHYLQAKKAVLKPTSYRIAKKNCEYITEYLGRCIVSKLNERQYESFRSELGEKDWAVSYKNKMIKQLRALLLYAEKMYGIKNNVMDKYDMFKDNSPVEKMQFYTIDQMKAFLDYCEKDNFAMFAFFQTLAYMGLRCGENNALTWHDIDFERNRLDINKSITTKLRDDKGDYLVQAPKTKQSIRVLPMPNQVQNALKRLKEEQMMMAGFSDDWRCYGGKTAIAETTLTHYKDRVMKQLDLPRISIHAFRHSFVSMCVSFGNVPISVISKMVGHSSIEQTAKVYSHLFISQLDDLAGIISNI